MSSGHLIIALVDDWTYTTRTLYIRIYIYILRYIKGMIRIYETHVFFFLSTIFQIPRRCWEDNDYVYALFYSAKGRLNIDIRAKFEQLAREWKWSRIHFGRIDVDKDWGWFWKVSDPPKVENSWEIHAVEPKIDILEVSNFSNLCYWRVCRFLRHF